MGRRVLVTGFAVSLLLVAVLTAVPATALPYCVGCRYFDFGWSGGLWACAAHTNLGEGDDCVTVGDYCYDRNVCLYWYA